MNQFTEQQLEEADRKHNEIRDAKVEKEQKLRIPTPRTDEEWASWPYAGPGISVHFGRELERELIAASTKLNDTLTAMAMLGDKHEQEMAAVTEQRDRLAEALRQMWPFIEEEDYPNCNTPAFNAAILKYKQALQSLTQPKKYDANEHQSFYP
jgi:hypothetical protein